MSIPRIFAKPEELRIGVFVCHCGLNIAGTIDVHAVAKYARSLSGVVYVKENRYTCADPGQEEIRQAICQQRLNRVVIAACSPRMHESTFRRTVAEAGLNSFLYEMANIREFASWCHQSDPRAATERAKDAVKMAVAKVRLLQSLQPIEVHVTNKALIIGGGIAGINAALELAEQGFQTYLLENTQSIGGHMAALDKTFPTLDCSICIEGPKMVDCARHPKITLFVNSDLVKCEGYVGNFKVTIRKNPQYVISEKCTGCGECRDACPIEYPNEWDLNLGTRKAISVPFDQAVPLVYSINRDYCIECFKCTEVCGDRAAIDFDQKPKEIILNVGAIIVSTGFDIYLPYDMPLLGYGKYSNVVTSMEFERLILAAGPTGGKVIRQSDGQRPRRIAFIQCVGSRDKQHYPYCCNFGCMYTLKHAVQLKEKYKEEVEIYVFYMDMRSSAKGYEEFYGRARERGVNFIRGRVSRIDEDLATHNLTVHSEDSLLGQPIELEVDLAVLVTAAIPKKDHKTIARILNLSCDTDGFFMEAHPKLKPLDSPTDGIFYAGACAGLKDIPYSVSQGSGAASRAATVLSKPTWKIEPIIGLIDEAKCKRCGVCVDKCPYGAIHQKTGHVASIIPASCHGCGTCAAECPHQAITQMHFTDAQIIAQIHAALETNPEDKIIAFLCNWCSYAGADLAGISRCDYPASVRAIRVMCSGRVAHKFVFEALKLGAGAVLIGACHLPYDCHYINGNYKMKVRMDNLKVMLTKLGLSPQRFCVEYISAAEGLHYADLIAKIDQQQKALGREKIQSENAKLKPILENMLKGKSSTVSSL
ncbi:MAG: hydrogenase iron-sulfur subunit [Nitrososphaerota archaeon]|jgi:heterodisulfide reductase subunit A|nr:hydrogenase iron-sulfur subunit [Nitrososphaerota archaeon]